MDDANSPTDGFKNLFQDRALAFLLVAAASAALVVATYHFVNVYLRNRRRPQRRSEYHHSASLRFTPPATPTRADGILAAELIPAHKFRKGVAADGHGDDVVCAVCLCEFEDGEEVRAMPGCAHVFHAPCIDMWLYSHSTCPICRAEATPSPMMLPPLESHRDSAEIRIDFRVLEGVAAVNQSRRS